MKRREILSNLPISLLPDDFSLLDQSLLLEDAERVSENVVGMFSLPFSVAANFLIDGEPVLVPMVTEEPSIVAACSKLAKMVGACGGFTTSIDRPLVRGQIQICDLSDIDKALTVFDENVDEMTRFARELTPRMNERGGGVIAIERRVIVSPKIGPMLIIEPLIDVVDAMGANVVNSVVESLAEKIVGLFDGNVVLRILSNLCDARLARARCSLSLNELCAPDECESVAERMFKAHALAEVDIYRACTHNKGVLNGVDAVAIATGNDFRAIEAGAHAYAAREGYRPLTNFAIDREKRVIDAELVMPLAVGVVGGIAHIHRGVHFSHKLLGAFAKTSSKLSSVMVSVGLAQCLAALLALSREGIQRGHMRLHNKKLDTLREQRVTP